MKTILLTGATGFLGSHLLEALLKEGYAVVILKRSTSNTWRIQHLLEQVKTYDVDFQPLEDAFKEQRINAVIHTACQYGRNGESIHQMVESNLMFGLKLLDAATFFNTGTFFNTDTLLQKHLNAYTLSKKQFVEWLRQQSEKIQVVNLRLEHMYGPKDDKTKFVPWVIDQLEQQVAEIKLTKGEQERDFVYIDDVVSAYLLTLEKSGQMERFTEFDVGTGRLTTVRNFVEALKSAYESKYGKSHTVLNFGALPYRVGEMMTITVDNTLLTDLGWAANISMPEGVAEIIRLKQ
jgi:CDP-paratose synthetase